MKKKKKHEVQEKKPISEKKSKKKMKKKPESRRRRWTLSFSSRVRYGEWQSIEGGTSSFNIIKVLYHSALEIRRRKERESAWEEKRMLKKIQKILSCCTYWLTITSSAFWCDSSSGSLVCCSEFKGAFGSHVQFSHSFRYGKKRRKKQQKQGCIEESE